MYKHGFSFSFPNSFDRRETRKDWDFVERTFMFQKDISQLYWLSLSTPTLILSSVVKVEAPCIRSFNIFHSQAYGH